MANHDADVGASLRRRPFLPATLVLMSVVMGCSSLTSSSPGTVSRGEWKASYLSARGALEAGQADAAAAAYARIVDASGPVGPRIRLEYAHALLRAENFSAAADEARQSAERQDGLGRAAALAVQAVAEHELARAQLAAGQADEALVIRLAAAGSTLDEVLAANDEIDPSGALAARRAEVTAEETRLRRQLGI